MKKINRRVILRKRNRLSREDIIKKSGLIKERLFASSEYKKAKTIMFYVSFGSEVDTMDIIKESLKEKRVCVPVIVGSRIIPLIIRSTKELNKRNRYGILEPPIEKTKGTNNGNKRIDKSEIDLAIIPGVVFDKRNHRIGYGKGYYDSFLKGFKGKTIGLAFDMQILELIPTDEWDVMLDRVISEA